jgi:hypothetical protein
VNIHDYICIGDILSSIACQLGIAEGGGVSGAEETGQRVSSFLGLLLKGSVLILDQVDMQIKYGVETSQKEDRGGAGKCVFIFACTSI